MGCKQASRIILGGLGGHGVVFLNRLLSTALVKSGFHIISSETHGMAQRGGIVIAHLSIGDNSSALIHKGTADILIAMDRHQAVRYLAYLRPGGVLLVNSGKQLEGKAMFIVNSKRIGLTCINANEIAQDICDVSCANMVMAGLAVNYMPVSLTAVIAVINKMTDNNNNHVQALNMGFSINSSTGNYTTTSF